MDTYFHPRETTGECNSLVAFYPDGTVTPVHSKVRVVPFGEVIPMKKLITGWFPDYYWGAEDISPGTGFHAVDTPAGKVGAAVCYESFFPQLTKRVIDKGAEILVLVSNTSWYDETRASYQHATFDVYRAVESGIWFCRAATTGISSVIDPKGNILFETKMFKSDAVTVGIGKRVGLTLYSRWGDWVPALCGIYILMLLLGVFLVREEES
jgi:apolipoprotein N-acyltransferase